MKGLIADTLQRIADFLNTATLREPDFADALPPAVFEL